MSETLLVIPTAKLLPTELQAEFGALPSAMVPLNNQPALSYILQTYQEWRPRTLIVVDEGRQSVQTYLARGEGGSAELCEAGGSRTLGETLLAALREAGGARHLVINFGDTLVWRRVRFQDTVVYAVRRESFRWTTFEIEGGKIEQLTDKQHEKTYPLENKVFVGVFEIAAPQLFAELLQDAVADGQLSIDPFYAALQRYVARRTQDGFSVTFEQTKDWHDFGHLDTYYATRRALSSGAREFNTIYIDARGGALAKRSRHTAKLRNEIRWYLNVPKNLQRFSPRLFDYSLDHDEPFVEMEYYGYPPLNDIYLHGAYGTGQWELILGAIDFYLGEMHRYRYEPRGTGRGDEGGELRAALTDMYEHKTAQRLTPILEDARFARFHDPLRVNGQPVLGLRQVLASLPAVAQAAGLYDLPFFTVLHGDLCLSNILFDRHNGAVRVIDPRGDFGGFDVYGDFRYDLAKLSHSIHGDYDFYVNGLFDIEDGEDGEDGVVLRPYFGAHHASTKQLFERWLGARWPDRVAQIRLIESLLFLSMVPLHADRFESQRAFLARGLELYTREAVACGLAAHILGEVQLAE